MVDRLGTKRAYGGDGGGPQQRRTVNGIRQREKLGQARAKGGGGVERKTESE